MKITNCMNDKQLLKILNQLNNDNRICKSNYCNMSVKHIQQRCKNFMTRYLQDVFSCVYLSGRKRVTVTDVLLRFAMGNPLEEEYIDMTKEYTLYTREIRKKEYIFQDMIQIKNFISYIERVLPSLYSVDDERVVLFNMKYFRNNNNNNYNKIQFSNKEKSVQYKTKKKHDRCPLRIKCSFVLIH